MKIEEIVAIILVSFLMGILFWGLLTQCPEFPKGEDINFKDLSKAIDSVGKAFGN